MPSLIDYEKPVKEQYAKDKYSPEMYSKIKYLTEKILVLKRMASNRKDVDAIATEYAMHLWGFIMEGHTVTSWTKYIMLGIRDYVWKNRRGYSPEQFEYPDIIDQQDFIHTLYRPNEYNSSKKLELDDYLNNIYKELLNIFMKNSPYTSPYINRYLFLSLLASYMTDTVLLIGLDERYTNDLRVLLVSVKYGVSETLSKFVEDPRDYLWMSHTDLLSRI